MFEYKSEHMFKNMGFEYHDQGERKNKRNKKESAFWYISSGRLWQLCWARGNHRYRSDRNVVQGVPRELTETNNLLVLPDSIQ